MWRRSRASFLVWYKFTEGGFMHIYNQTRKSLLDLARSFQVFDDFNNFLIKEGESSFDFVSHRDPLITGITLGHLGRWSSRNRVLHSADKEEIGW